MDEVLILGGYGNFGKRIARALVRDGISVIIVGRHQGKAEAFARELGSLAKAAAFDANEVLASRLEHLRPTVLINACGPFQAADFRIPETCIENGVPYLDLADARAFVTGIGRLDAKAKEKGVAVISGASTVPGLSSAVLEHYKPEFSRIDELVFGISPGQKAERGLATTQGILTYVGKPLKPFAGHPDAYGWQDIYRQAYPELGKRWMANCDIPDLDLLPARYGIASIRFSAGLELAPMHLGLWFLSWIVRLGMPLNLPKFAAPLLAMANVLNFLGSADGGMHMIMRGRNLEGKPHERRWFIIARESHGPHITTVPAIVLAKKFIKGAPAAAGAYPCIGLVSLEEYLMELEGYPISTVAA